MTISCRPIEQVVGQLKWYKGFGFCPVFGPKFGFERSFVRISEESKVCSCSGLNSLALFKDTSLIDKLG